MNEYLSLALHVSFMYSCDAPCLLFSTVLFFLCCSVSYNEIDAEGAEAFTKALEVNTSLTSLDLKENELGPEGGVALADALRVNPSLTSLE